MKKNSTKTPQNLGDKARKLWLETIKNFQLEQHHIAALEAACRCLDRIEEAQQAIDKDGAFLTDRYGGKKEHPGHKVEQQNKVIFARLIRELQLDLPADDETSRPARLY